MQLRQKNNSVKYVKGVNLKYNRILFRTYWITLSINSES